MELETWSDIGVEFYSTARVQRLLTFGSVILLLVAILLWGQSLSSINLRGMTDVGLISVLPTSSFVALICLCLSFCLALHQQQLRSPLLLLHIIVLIFMLYGITALVEETPRFPVTWRHTGVIDYVVRNRSVDPNIDAYFNWPGFFIFAAFVTEAAGLKSAISFGAWASVFFNLLYLGPLWMIFSSARYDKRIVWLGIWFFYQANWIGQDYFSPQALNYFLYLVILAILLRWFGVENLQSNFVARYEQSDRWLLKTLGKIIGRLTPEDITTSSASRWQRIILLAVVVLLYLVIVSGHQLTPFFVVASVTTLVVCRRCSVRGLPLLMVVLLVTWLSFMTVPYLAGHLNKLVGQVGQVDEAVSKNLTGRLQGSPGHILVVYMRIGVTLVVWGMGFLGWLRGVRNGHGNLTYALLAASPFPVLGLQAYGGEMLLRVYLFALPFAVFFAATLFFTTPTARASWKTIAATSAVSLLLLGSFLVARYGNERMDYFTAKEAEAVAYLYRVAPPGSLLVTVSPNTPWKYQDYEKHHYKAMLDLIRFGDVNELARQMNTGKFAGSYLILTRAQQAYAELFYGIPSSSWEQFEKDLENSKRFKTIYSNQDGKVLILSDGMNEGER